MSELYLDLTLQELIITAYSWQREQENFFIPTLHSSQGIEPTPPYSSLLLPTPFHEEEYYCHSKRGKLLSSI